jgi:anti-anti-sigma factor
MHAHVHLDSFGNLYIQIHGELNFENMQWVRQELYDLSEKYPASSLTIDFFKLDFVGSSGMNHFVETIQTLLRRKASTFICHLRSEFYKVFQLYGLKLDDEYLTPYIWCLEGKGKVLETRNQNYLSPMTKMSYSLPDHESLNQSEKNLLSQGFDISKQAQTFKNQNIQMGTADEEKGTIRNDDNLIFLDRKREQMRLTKKQKTDSGMEK